MAGCCGSRSSNTRIEAGEGALVTGVGSAGDPFVVSLDSDIIANPASPLLVTIQGAGTSSSPHVVTVSYREDSSLRDLPDVSDTEPLNGQVLVWNEAAQQYIPAAQGTAATGAVQHDLSLTGDGSAGAPLAVRTGAGLDVTDDGLVLDVDAREGLVAHYATALDRDFAMPEPVPNVLTMLDERPGVIDYWDGSAWQPTQAETTREAVGPGLLEMSGPYDGRPVREVFVTQQQVTTDAAGNFVILAPEALVGATGVLSVAPVTLLSQTAGFTSVALSVAGGIVGTLLTAAGAPAAAAVISFHTVVTLY